MGTKNQPGEFDCYANAEPDEPLFILLGRDKHAPTLVWLWAALRELDGERPEVVKESRECAVKMIKYAAERGRPSVGLGQSVLAGVFELIRGANAAGEKALNSPSSLDVVRAWFTTTKFESAADPATEPAGDGKK